MAVVRLGQSVLPFAVLQRILRRLGHETRRSADPPAAREAQQIGEAIRVASRVVPGRHTCLTRALAVQVWLSRRGHSVGLRIGVAKTEEAPLLAHAWVESEGRVVIGDDQDLSRYRILNAGDRSGWLIAAARGAGRWE